MGWIYNQRTGQFWRNDGTGARIVWVGYSGHEAGRNNPAMQEDRGVGPIPVGKYLIGQFFDHPEKGPIVAHLTPLPETNVFGRDGFMLHGDSILKPGTASLGCIIQSKKAREACRDSNDYNLEVISGEVTQSGSDAIR